MKQQRKAAAQQSSNPTAAATAPTAAQVLARRRWIKVGMGAVAVGALGAGAAVAWRQCSGPAQEAQSQAERDFWALQLPTLDGQLQSLAHYRGQPLLVNFWATWCPPCVRELPLLSRFAQQQHDVQVLGIAVDQAGNVARWLQRTPLDFPVLLAETGGVALTRQLGNLQGGLPFSLLWSARGQIRARRIGEFSADILQQWQAIAAQAHSV